MMLGSLRCVSRTFATAVASAACVFAAGALPACAGPGEYVWFNAMSPETRAATTEYVIKSGDTLMVRVLTHDELSGRVVVRPDGKIALPLIGEVAVMGKPPATVRTDLEAKFKDYIVSPSVSVALEDTRPIVVRVIGEVAHPGSFSVTSRADLAEALALSGGLTDYATRDRIFVVREQPRTRIRFTYEAVSRNVGGAAAFLLQAGDLVVVE